MGLALDPLQLAALGAGVFLRLAVELAPESLGANLPRVGRCGKLGRQVSLDSRILDGAGEAFVRPREVSEGKPHLSSERVHACVEASCPTAHATVRSRELIRKPLD